MNKSFIKLILGVYTVAFSMFFFIKNRELGLESMYVFAFYFICAIPIFLLYTLKKSKVKWKLILIGIISIMFALLVSINVTRGGLIFDIEIGDSSVNIEEKEETKYYDYDLISISWNNILEYTYFVLLYTLLLICIKDYINNKEGKEDILVSISLIVCIIIYINALFNPNLQKKTYYLEYDYIIQNYLIFIIIFISLIIYKYINKKELCDS